METSTRMLSLDVKGAAERLKKVVVRTPLILNHNLSRKYQCNVYLKREDLQVVRSYKIRGAYNMMSSISPKFSTKAWYVQAPVIMHRDLPIPAKN